MTWLLPCAERSQWTMYADGACVRDVILLLWFVSCAMRMGRQVHPTPVLVAGVSYSRIHAVVGPEAVTATGAAKCGHNLRGGPNGSALPRLQSVSE